MAEEALMRSMTKVTKVILHESAMKQLMECSQKIDAARKAEKKEEELDHIKICIAAIRVLFKGKPLAVSLNLCLLFSQPSELEK